MATTGALGRAKGAVARAKLRLEHARADYPAVDIGMRTISRYSDDDGGFFAAALTYYVFFSLFPIVLFGISILGFLLKNDPQLQKDLVEAGVEGVPLLNSILTPAVLQAIRDSAGGLALLSLLLTLYSGTGGIVALVHALNRINRVEVERGFVAKRLTALKWLAVMGAAVGASLMPSTIADVAVNRGGAAGIALTVFAHVAGAALAVGVFALAYRLLPNKPLTWTDVLPGAVLAGIVFEILKLLGARYVLRGAEGRSAAFGAYATAATLLVVSYLLSQVVLLGAEVNAVVAERRETRQSSLEPPKEA